VRLSVSDIKLGDGEVKLDHNKSYDADQYQQGC